MKIKSSIKPYEIFTNAGKIQTEKASITTDDITWYINASTGDDDTGDGSVGSPFKSFDVLERLPSVIAHTITILPAAGAYTTFPESLNVRVREGGSLLIDASDETPTEVVGSLAVNTISSIGGTLYYSLNVSPDPSWVTNAYKDSFILMSDGDSSGKVFRICSNTSDTLVVYVGPSNTISSADNFSIVDPPVVITVDHPVTIFGDSADPVRVGFAMAGLKFALSGPYVAYQALFTVNNLSWLASLTSIKSGTTGAYPTLRMQNTVLNTTEFAVGLANSDLEDISCIGCQVSNSSSSNGDDVECVDSEVHGIGCWRHFNVYGRCYLGSVDASHIEIRPGSIMTRPRYPAQMALRTEDRGVGEFGLEMHELTVADIDLYSSGNGRALHTRESTRCLIRKIGADNLTYDEAIHIGVMSTIVNADGDLPVGAASKSFKFQGNSESYEITEMATGDTYTDLMGAYITKISDR